MDPFLGPASQAVLEVEMQRMRYAAPHAYGNQGAAIVQGEDDEASWRLFQALAQPGQQPVKGAGGRRSGVGGRGGAARVRLAKQLDRGRSALVRMRRAAVHRAQQAARDRGLRAQLQTQQGASRMQRGAGGASDRRRRPPSGRGPGIRKAISKKGRAPVARGV